MVFVRDVDGQHVLSSYVLLLYVRLMAGCEAQLTAICGVSWAGRPWGLCGPPCSALGTSVAVLGRLEPLSAVLATLGAFVGGLDWILRPWWRTWAVSGRKVVQTLAGRQSGQDLGPRTDGEDPGIPTDPKRRGPGTPSLGIGRYYTYVYPRGPVVYSDRQLVIQSFGLRARC